MEGAFFRFGGNVADVLADKDGRDYKIEIKATGSKKFQYFSDKDVTTDYIVWMHFGDFFMGNKNIR